MIDKVFVVMGSRGEYSDRCEWPACFVETEEEAERLVVEKTQAAAAAAEPYRVACEAYRLAEEAACRLWFVANKEKMRVAYPAERNESSLEYHAWLYDPGGRAAWTKVAGENPSHEPLVIDGVALSAWEDDIRYFIYEVPRCPTCAE